MGKCTELTTKQLKCIEYMCGHMDDPLLKVAEACGVHFNSLYKWNKQELFRNKLEEELHKTFKDSSRLAINTILNCVKNGDRAAAIYVLDNTGYKLPDKNEVDIATSDVIRINIG